MVGRKSSGKRYRDEDTIHDGSFGWNSSLARDHKLGETGNEGTENSETESTTEDEETRPDGGVAVATNSVYETSSDKLEDPVNLPVDPREFEEIVRDVPKVESYTGQREERIGEELWNEISHKVSRIEDKYGQRGREEFIEWFKENEGYSKSQKRQVEKSAKDYPPRFVAMDYQGFPQIPSAEVNQEGDIYRIEAESSDSYQDNKMFERDMMDLEAEIIDRREFSGELRDFPGYTGEKGDIVAYSSDEIGIVLDYSSETVEIEGRTGTELMEDVAGILDSVFDISRSDYTDLIREEGYNEESQDIEIYGTLP